MDNEILGKYDNDNYTLFNILANSTDESSTRTKLHESIHMLLTLQTRWGGFEYYFNHISKLIDNSFYYIPETIHTYCLNVQEGLSELWENLYIYKYSKDEALFFKRIMSEKFKNPLTYEYLKKMIPIFQQTKYSVEELAFFIYRTALYAMNNQIENIPVSTWSKNAIKSYFIEKETPDNLFEKKLVELQDALKDNNALTNYLHSIETDWSTSDIDSRASLVNNLTSYILQICQSSTHFQEIKIYLSTIHPKYIDLEQIDEYTIPTTFTSYEWTTIKLPPSICFVGGTFDDFLYTVKNKIHIKVPYYVKSGNIMILYFSHPTKNIFGDYISKSKFQKILKSTSYPIVVSYKAIENNPQLVRLLNYSKRKYYVYCDRPYATAKLTIENMCKDKHYKIFEFNNFDIICLKLYQNGLLFIPVSDDANFIRDCTNDFYSGVVKESTTLLSCSLEEQELNLITNCIYQT